MSYKPIKCARSNKNLNSVSYKVPIFLKVIEGIESSYGVIDGIISLFILSQASNNPIHSTSFCGAFSLSGFPLLNTYCDLASPSSLHFPCVSAQPRRSHGGGRGRRGSAGGAPADRGQRLLQEGPPRRRHRLLHRGKLSSPRVHFSCPLDSKQNKYIFFPRLWLWHQIKNVSLRDETLIGNRALPRRRRLLDESGPMPFQAQVSS